MGGLSRSVNISVRLSRSDPTAFLDRVRRMDGMYVPHVWDVAVHLTELI